MTVQEKGRILLVCETLGPGGAERQIVTDANLLTANRWNVTLAYWATGRLVSTLNPAVAQYYIKSRNWLGRLFSLYVFCRNGRFDLVHAHLTGANLLASVVGRLLNIPIIITEHGLGLWRLEKLKFRLVVSLTYLLANRIVSVCEATQRIKIQREGANQKKTLVIHNCYDPGFALKESCENHCPTLHSIPPDARVVGFVGRVIPVKRPDLLFRIAQRVVEHLPETRFLVVGDGPGREILTRLLLDYGLYDSFVFVGQQNDVVQFHSLMDIFVLTSEREALSIALLEAMASGLPSVVFDVGGNSEVVVQGETGFVVPFQDCEGFAGRLIQLLTDNDFRQAMGGKARMRSREMFSPEIRLKRLEELYRQTLQSS